MEKPKLRFKEFESLYRTCLLNNCLEVTNNRNEKLVYSKEDALSVSDEEGVVNQIKHLGRSYTSSDVSNYKILEYNQVVYTKSPLKLKPFGIVKTNRGECGIVSVLYAVYNVLEGIDPNYINYYFEPFYRINNYLRPLISKGAKNTINVSDDMALMGSVSIPLSIEEQKKVSSFFQSIDRYIDDISKRILSFKQIKAACLQSMFPQEGELVPKVRFKGFKETWKKVELGQLFQERNESNIYGEMLSVTLNKGIIKASENGRFDTSNSDKSKYKVVCVNDIAYNSMRMWQGASGCSSYEGIVSPAYTVLVPSKNVDSKFFSYLFKTNIALQLFKLNSQGLTSDNWNLKYPTLSKIKMTYPTNIEEQHKISIYFENLDEQISLQTQRLEKLKQIKSACLDKMFV